MNYFVFGKNVFYFGSSVVVIVLTARVNF